MPRRARTSCVRPPRRSRSRTSRSNRRTDSYASLDSRHGEPVGTVDARDSTPLATRAASSNSRSRSGARSDSLRRAEYSRPGRPFPRHRQAGRARLGAAQASELNDYEWEADAKACRRRRPHHRAARLPSRRGSGHSPPPRALRRLRLSGRLAGEEIPLGARIIHVADALDSMLTTRTYRSARQVSRRSSSCARTQASSSARAASRRSRTSCRPRPVGEGRHLRRRVADSALELAH